MASIENPQKSYQTVQQITGLPVAVGRVITLEVMPFLLVAYQKECDHSSCTQPQERPALFGPKGVTKPLS
jgi:hypothetical protein